jgi:hypothetical protein
MSRTSAYLLRRRDAVFADAWTAALVLARRHVEEVLATRALDGVEEAVWFRGELVGVRRRYDSRLLLAHLARLDVAGEGHEALAERFDEVLALVAGEEPCADVPGMEDGTALPPERADYVAAAGEARFGDAREAWLDAVDAIDAAAGYVQPLDEGEIAGRTRGRRRTIRRRRCAGLSCARAARSGIAGSRALSPGWTGRSRAGRARRRWSTSRWEARWRSVAELRLWTV